jgi:acetyl esterase/lipase
MPARPDYFPFLSALRKDLSASLGDFGVALLEYCELSLSCATLIFSAPVFIKKLHTLALAPESPMPIQLRQANAALTHLLNKGIPPANIIIGGDSAGGNLVLQLLSHILHPLPSIPALPALAQPLAGALLISPWCASSVEAPSYTRNDSKDLLPTRFYKSVGVLVKEGLTPELEPYFESLLAPDTWWNGLDGVCARILITAGENEGLLDDALKMGTVISRHVQDTTTVAEPGAVHEEVIVKFAAGEGGTGKDYDTIVAFLSRSFGVAKRGP